MSPVVARDRYAHLRRPGIQPSDPNSASLLAGYFLQGLAPKLYGTLYNDILQDSNEYEAMWSQLPNPDWGSSTMRGPMHWHPAAVVPAGKDITDICNAIVEAKPGPLVISLAEKVISLWTSANSLRQLHRFLDSRQPHLLRDPLPDGSNLHGHTTPNDPDASLQCEWMFRRIFIRHLHLPGLWHNSANPGERARGFCHLYGASRALLEMELERCPPEDTDEEFDNFILDPYDPDLEKMNDIKRSRNIIEQVLMEVAKVAIEEQHTARVRFFPDSGATQIPMTRNSRLQHNLSPDLMHITLQKMINKYEEFMANYPVQRLIMDLLGKEDTFERLLTDEHVEDRLINKQIIPFDELSVVEAQQVNHFSLEDTFSTSESGAKFDNFIHQVTKGISLVNRQRRNFRLMRDWLRARPWYQLFHVYDTKLRGQEWLRNVIAIFVQAGLREPYRDVPRIPSNTDNVTSCLFGIYPLDVDSVPREERSILHCDLCNADIQGGDGPANTIAVLPCQSKHSFHLACVMRYWDAEGRFTQPCPTCHSTPALNHQRLGMVYGSDDPHFDTADRTFVHNTFGWITRPARHPNVAPINDYNIPPESSNHRFWQRENLLAAAVENAPITWRGESMSRELLTRRLNNNVLNTIVKDLGTKWRLRARHINNNAGGVRDDNYDAARFAPSQELAWLRMKRRRRDRRRRLQIAQAGGGLARYITQM